MAAETIEHHGHAAGGGLGWLVGVILLALALFLLFWYGLPALQNRGGGGVTVPGQIDVNINRGGAPQAPGQ